MSIVIRVALISSLRTRQTMNSKHRVYVFLLLHYLKPSPLADGMPERWVDPSKSRSIRVREHLVERVTVEYLSKAMRGSFLPLYSLMAQSEWLHECRFIRFLCQLEHRVNIALV